MGLTPVTEADFVLSQEVRDGITAGLTPRQKFKIEGQIEDRQTCREGSGDDASVLSTTRRFRIAYEYIHPLVGV